MARAPPSFLLLALAAAAALLLTGPAAAHEHASQSQQHHSQYHSTPATGKGPLSHLAYDTGLAFSGSGFLAVFHLGALQALQDLGLATQATRVAGTSGGSLMSGINCLGVPQKDAQEIAQSINDNCRGDYSCAGHLDRAVQTAIRSAVDKGMIAAGLSARAPQADRDAFVVKQCAGRATFNMSLVDPSAKPEQAIKAAQSWPVSNFTSEEDFTRAGEASAFVPLMSVRWHTEFRGAAVVDGMFSSGLPPKCVDASVRQCVSIKAVTKEPQAQADISPGQYSPLPDGLTPDTWQRHAMMAPSAKMAADMEAHGYEQAVLWACKAHPRSMESTGKCTGKAGGGGSSSGKKTPSPKTPWQVPRKMLPSQWQVPALG